jgi:hypothetical protein
VSGATFTYQTDGEDYAFIGHLFPRLASASGLTMVRNSSGDLSVFDPHRFAGNLVLDHQADPTTARLLTDAVSASLPTGTSVTTDQLRRVSDLVHSNPFAAPAADIVGTP